MLSPKLRPKVQFSRGSPPLPGSCCGGRRVARSDSGASGPPGTGRNGRRQNPTCGWLPHQGRPWATLRMLGSVRIICLNWLIGMLSSRLPTHRCDSDSGNCVPEICRCNRFFAVTQLADAPNGRPQTGSSRAGSRQPPGCRTLAPQLVWTLVGTMRAICD